MGVSFRMDGWLGNSGFLPDGEGAVGTGRASLGGIRSHQSTQSRKNTDERSEAARTPRKERQRSPARRRERRRNRLGGAVSARRRGVGLFECSLVMGGGVFSLATFALVSLATFALVSLATFLPLVSLVSRLSRLFSFLSCSRPLLVPKSSGHLLDLCNLVISSHSYDNKRNYLTFTFCRAILNSGGGSPIKQGTCARDSAKLAYFSNLVYFNNFLKIMVMFLLFFP